MTEKKSRLRKKQRVNELSGDSMSAKGKKPSGQQAFFLPIDGRSSSPQILQAGPKTTTEVSGVRLSSERANSRQQLIDQLYRSGIPNLKKQG